MARRKARKNAAARRHHHQDTTRGTPKTPRPPKPGPVREPRESGLTVAMLAQAGAGTPPWQRPDPAGPPSLADIESLAAWVEQWPGPVELVSRHMGHNPPPDALAQAVTAARALDAAGALWDRDPLDPWPGEDPDGTVAALWDTDPEAATEAETIESARAAVALLATAGLDLDGRQADQALHHAVDLANAVEGVALWDQWATEPGDPNQGPPDLSDQASDALHEIGGYLITVTPGHNARLVYPTEADLTHY